MKNTDVRSKRSLLYAALLCLSFAVFAAAQVSGSVNFCSIQLSRCPQEYNNKDIMVPLNVVAITASVQACGIADSTPYTVSGGAPAIMFVIDHSRSMTTNSEGGPGNDPRGNRFRVTKALIDTIYKSHPDALVGVALFAEGLVLQKDWDQNIVLFQGVTNPTGGNDQSYLPLKALNTPVGNSNYASISKPNGGPYEWRDVVQGMFNVPKSQSDTATLVNGETRKKADERAGTNISIAFEAALTAFKALDSDPIPPPKQNRFIIFLSDGEPELYNGGSVECSENPQLYPSNQRCGMQYNFVDGAMPIVSGGPKEKLPTTYTVFLSTNPNYRPPNLNNMTNNIKKNGYSSSNPSSNIWVRTSDYNSLFSLMMSKIVTNMISKSSGKPKTIVISSAGVNQSAGEIDGSFTFSRWLPLDTAVPTKVSMGITYGVTNDVSSTEKDSTLNYGFTIRRTADPGENWQEEQNLSSSCGNRPSLDLLYIRDKDTTSIVDGEVKEYMGVLQIVFDNTGGLFNYPDKFTVQVLNDDASDVEYIELSKDSDGKWRGQFPREEKLPTTPGDGKLQHTGQDEVIVVFRNPEVPLDTIRVAVPYISNRMKFYDSPGDPSKGKPFLTTVNVKVGDKLELYVKLFDASDNWDPVMTANGDKITWTVSTNESVLTKDPNEGAHGTFRTETMGEYKVTATYRDGELVISNSINIVVGKGDPYYLEIVTDSAEINYGREMNPANLMGTKEFAFKKDMSSTVFYAVLRDAYGNYLGLAENAVWTSDVTKSITVDPPLGHSTVVSKHGNEFGNNLYVRAQTTVINSSGKSVVISAQVHIVVVGESYAAVSPNPYIINESPPIMERLRQRGYTGSPVDYSPIVANSKSGDGNGNAESVSGILVVATAPRAVKTGTSINEVMYVMDAKAIIYDAVGRVVFRSKPGDLVTPDGNTFGFVWNCKNTKDKKVGPGTYAMQITATMVNGEKFFVQRMIGVKLNEN